jgi:hypothetical protein
LTEISKTIELQQLLLSRLVQVIPPTNIANTHRFTILLSFGRTVRAWRCFTDRFGHAILLMRNLFLSIAISIQWTMSLLVVRLTRVRSSWIATSPTWNVRLQKICQTRDSGRPWGFGDLCIPQRSLSTGQKFQSSSSLPMVPRWNVGDSVQVQLDDNQTLGVIKEDRGRGWYSIAIPEGNTILKCRGTLLSPTPTPAAWAAAAVTSTVQEQMTTLFGSKINEPEATLRIDPGSNPDLLSPPPPSIDDLDAVLLGATQGGDASSDVEFLEQLAHHSSFQKWVVFTDLHCAPSTLDTSLQVLSKVHELAVAKNAGKFFCSMLWPRSVLDNDTLGDGQELTHNTAAIKHAGVLFLGDFWHHRGTLRVDCLNAVLEHLQGWKVSTIEVWDMMARIDVGELTPSCLLWTTKGTNGIDPRKS